MEKAEKEPAGASFFFLRRLANVVVMFCSDWSMHFIQDVRAQKGSSCSPECCFVFLLRNDGILVKEYIQS